MRKCTRCGQPIEFNELCVSPRNNAPYHVPCFKDAEAERELAAYVLGELKLKCYTPKMKEQKRTLNQTYSDSTILQTLKYLKEQGPGFRDFSLVASNAIVAESYFNDKTNEIRQQNARYLQALQNAQSPQKLAEAKIYRQLAARRAWLRANK